MRSSADRRSASPILSQENSLHFAEYYNENFEIAEAGMKTGGQSGLRARNYLIQAEFLRGNVADWEVYPFTVPSIRGFDRLIFEQPVTFLVGENGSGKSTLLEAIAVAWGFNP